MTSDRSRLLWLLTLALLSLGALVGPLQAQPGLRCPVALARKVWEVIRDPRYGRILP